MTEQNKKSADGRRVFLVVLDSCGAGEMPDAAEFGDRDCNTLRRISENAAFSCENTRKMGLGNIEGLSFLGITPRPTGAFGKLAERSHGKDTTTGHWEIAGVVSPRPMPTFPQGFPAEVLEAFSAKTGRGVLCNRPYSGTQVIKDYGEEHLRTGKLIVYTSADSVFQVAAHESLVPLSELYADCRAAREILQGPYGVGRVIARPFTGEAPDFVRTPNRRDFSLEPPEETLLDAVKKSGQTVWAIGKISDIFAGRGVTRSVLTHGNAEGMREILRAQAADFSGLCFLNLVDFDMLYGHRQDVPGYAAAFAAFDRWLPSFLARMRQDDLLMITADHGCDPGDAHTDHTREYIPLLVYGAGVLPVDLGVRPTFADIGATVADYLQVPFVGAGESFWPLIKQKN